MPAYQAVIDATQYPPKEKHPLIIRTFEQLQPSAAMLLVNDHDPIPLRYQFAAEYPGQFSWEYVEQGPDVFRVKITKL